jgi:hypothetical protein
MMHGLGQGLLTDVKKTDSILILIRTFSMTSIPSIA